MAGVQFIICARQRYFQLANQGNSIFNNVFLDFFSEAILRITLFSRMTESKFDKATHYMMLEAPGQ